MIKATIRLFGLVTAKIRDDNVAAFSAQATFFIIISFFPFLMLLLGIIQYLPLDRSTMLSIFTDIFPAAINPIIVSIIVNSNTSSTLISITAITTLWSAAKGFFAIMKGLNAVYEINETRQYFLLRAISAFYTLMFAIMLIATMILFVFGNRLYLWIEQKIPG
jgi:membrane protein